MFDDKLRWVSIISSAIGLVDSIYLGYVKLTHQEVYCGGSGACESVNNSPYAEINGIPIAYLGVFAYIVILVLILMESRGGFWGEYSPIVVFGMTLAGFLYSVYLTYIEIYVLHAICPYCVVSAIVMLVLFIVSSVRLIITLRY